MMASLLPSPVRAACTAHADLLAAHPERTLTYDPEMSVAVI